MAWSLEEKLLVVGTQDGIVAVWDMEEYQVIHILTGHTGEAREVAQDHLLPGVSPPSVSPQIPFTANSVLCIKTLALILHLLSPHNKTPQNIVASNISCLFSSLSMN